MPKNSRFHWHRDPRQRPIYINRPPTASELATATWGAITGTLANQTDLNTALAGKQPLGSYATTTDLTNGLSTKYDASNPNGYINSIDSSMVTAALGYTPTSVTGLTGIQTVSAFKTGLSLNNVENKSSSTIRSEITSANVTGALGFTPYNATNPNGYISGNQTITFSGDATGSGTTSVSLTVTKSSGAFQITGGSFVAPTAGTGRMYATAADGLVIGGSGTSTDLHLLNKNGSSLVSWATGTTTGTYYGPLILRDVTFAVPTAGTGKIHGSTSSGLVLTGSGATSDIDASNKSGTTIFNVPTGTNTFQLWGKLKFGTLPSDFADDAAAAAGGLAIGDVYRTGSVLKVRVI